MARTPQPPGRSTTVLLVQQIVNGLALGAVFTLVALAFSVNMGILGVLNAPPCLSGGLASPRLSAGRGAVPDGLAPLVAAHDVDEEVAGFA